MEINVARRYFAPGECSGGRRRTYRPVSQPSEDEADDSREEDEIDDAWRRSLDLTEFEAHWAAISPDLGELLKREPPAEVGNLKSTCWRLFPSIKGMFLYYAALDAKTYSRLLKSSKEALAEWSAGRGASSRTSIVKTISKLEFMQFLKDTGLVTRKGSRVSITKEDAELIFTRANWERDAEGHLGQDDSNPDRELTGHEWLHALLRIALRIPSLGEKPLCRRVQECIQGMMLPKAGKVDMSEFEARFANPHVQAVLESNQFLLKSLFNYFAAGTPDAEHHDDGDLRRLSSLELLDMCRQVAIVNEFCPEEVILTSHVLSQREGSRSAEEASLSYNEFLRAVCRIADLWVPDKYLKLSVKVSSLVDHIRPWAPLTNKERAQSADRRNGELLDDLGARAWSLSFRSSFAAPEEAEEAGEEPTDSERGEENADGERGEQP
uniref:Uncharacterized protein n=1 Tax=Tetraselmis sp. GSL018 TaxID=582737 RepID=A0A061SBB3_9CHLO